MRARTEAGSTTFVAESAAESASMRRFAKQSERFAHAGVAAVLLTAERDGEVSITTERPGDATLAEFRAQLRLNGEPLSEVWLYRWTVS